MKHTLALSFTAAFTITTAYATTISTDFGGASFNPSFTAGTPNSVDVSVSPVVIGTGFTASFNDGLAIQGSANGGLYDNFFGPGNAANTGNNAAFFILNNGGGGVSFNNNPLTANSLSLNNDGLFIDNIDTASVTFSQAISDVSFAFQILGNGGSSFVDFLDFDGNVIANESINLIESDTDRSSIATFTDFSLDTTSLGTDVFGIQFNNAGPAGNPPYGIVVDTFSATAVPEPSSALLAGLALGLPFLRRRR